MSFRCQYNGFSERYAHEVVSPQRYTYYHNNSSVSSGYAFTGHIRGSFAIKLSRLRGVVGVYPQKVDTSMTNTLPYSILISSNVLIQLDNQGAQKDPRGEWVQQQRRCRENGNDDRFTIITVLKTSQTSAIRYKGILLLRCRRRRRRRPSIHYFIRSNIIVLPYDALTSSCNGLHLNTIAAGNELCLIESNENLAFIFDDVWDDAANHPDSLKNCFVMNNHEATCRLLCNIDYSHTELWYSDRETIPYSLHIKLSEPTRKICDGRRSYVSNLILCTKSKHIKLINDDDNLVRRGETKMSYMD